MPLPKEVSSMTEIGGYDPHSFIAAIRKDFPGWWDEDAIRESYKAHGLDLDTFLQSPK